MQMMTTRSPLCFYLHPCSSKVEHPRTSDLVLVLLLRYTYCCWRNLLLYPKRQLSVRLTSRARALVFSPSASSSSMTRKSSTTSMLVSMPFLFSLPFESARGTSEETGNRAFRVNICVCVFCVQFLISLFLSLFLSLSLFLGCGSKISNLKISFKNPGFS